MATVSLRDQIEFKTKKDLSLQWLRTGGQEDRGKVHLSRKLKLLLSIFVHNRNDFRDLTLLNPLNAIIWKGCPSKTWRIIMLIFLNASTSLPGHKMSNDQKYLSDVTVEYKPVPNIWPHLYFYIIYDSCWAWIVLSSEQQTIPVPKLCVYTENKTGFLWESFTYRSFFCLCDCR